MSLNDNLCMTIQEFFRVHPWLSHSFAITTSTPLDHVVAYFTDTAGIQNLTFQLEHALNCSSHPIVCGGLADIYRATLQDGTQVAIKCLRRTTHSDSKEMKRTARELDTWSKLRHENVLEFHGLCKFKNCLAMVSPWMGCGNVVSVVNQLPDTNRLGLVMQLSKAVAYLHKIGVVHGDLKGDNVLVSSDGVIKLTDFGLAIMNESNLLLSDTDPGGGTMRWMAPELLTGSGVRGIETDVYALGMTILEIITGEVPFPELRSSHAIINAVVRDCRSPNRPMQLSDKSPENVLLWSLLHRCWAYRPDRRIMPEETVILLGFL
ncbi:kinase-like protein [Ceratobasidium sp. AG-I]|nr:kinase-like protein [Ceratobasidium sp. AG-I]